MPQADNVADLLDSQTGKIEIPELAATVQSRGIENDVVVDMRLVDVGRYDKSMAAFGKAHRQFIAHLIGFLRRDFSRLEGLPYLVGDDIVLLFPAGDVFILPLGEQKFFVSGLRVTLKTADVSAAVRLGGVLGIVRPVGQTLRHSLSLVHMERDQPCRRHKN